MDWEPSKKDLTGLNEIRERVGLQPIEAGRIKTSGQWQQACSEVDELAESESELDSRVVDRSGFEAGVEHYIENGDYDEAWNIATTTDTKTS